MLTRPAILRLKRFRKRFGITAPRVVVRAHFPVHWYVGVALVVVVLLLSIAWAFFQRYEMASLDRELLVLRERVSVQSEELSRLRPTAGTEQNQVRMERSTKQSLVAKIQELERENALLKEDIRSFEKLVPVPGEEGGVRVESVRLSQEPDGRYRYRLMFSFQPSKQVQDFRGRLQLWAEFHHEGKDKKERVGFGEGSDSLIEIRHFLRRSGLFSLPAGGRLKSFEVRVFQGDTLKAERSARLGE